MVRLINLQTLLQVNFSDESVNSAINTMVTPQASEIKLSLWQLYLYGGWIMWVLLAMSILVVYIFVERMIMLKKASKDDKLFMDSISTSIRNGKIEEAKTLCKYTNSPLSRMIEKGICSLGKPLQDISAAIENIGRLEVANLEKNVNLLATVSGASPMLGFLGTVIGMVNAFYHMSMAGSNLNISMLSEGIYQAMITTVGGLIVGIFGYMLYNYLVTRIEKVVTLLETKTVEFLDVLDEPAEK